MKDDSKRVLSMLEVTPNLEELSEGWSVEIRFREAVLGGLPLDERSQLGWITKLGIDPAELRDEEEAGVYLPAPDEDEVAQKTATQISGFKRDGEGPVLEPRHIRAALVHSASDMGWTRELRGLKPALKDGIVIQPRWIGLYRDGTRISEPDGLHVIHMSARVPGRGQMGIIRRPEMIGDSPTCSFTFRVLSPLLRLDATINLGHRRFTGAELLCTLTKLAGEKGIGQARREGLGKFDVLTYAAC